MKTRRGRPCRVFGEPASERIWAWVTKSERSALDAFAKETRTDVAVIVRDAVNEYVADCSERRIFSVTTNSRAPLS